MEPQMDNLPIPDKLVVGRPILAAAAFQAAKPAKKPAAGRIARQVRSGV
jgi:hypothetical protein